MSFLVFLYVRATQRSDYLDAHNFEDMIKLFSWIHRNPAHVKGNTKKIKSLNGDQQEVLL